MKFVLEYHLIRGGFVAREVESEDEMNKIVQQFAGSRKGVHQFSVVANDRKALLTVPLEGVQMLLSEVREDESEEETDNG